MACFILFVSLVRTLCSLCEINARSRELLCFSAMISASEAPAARKDRLWPCVFGLAVLLGLIHNWAVLVGYGPDEVRHMNFVTLLIDEHRLPLILPDGTEYAGAHPLHPPYYYFLLVPIIALFRGLPGAWEWHIARLVSLALCLGALVLLRQIALVAGADKPRSARAFALFVVVGVGLLPIFGMTAGTINNDSAMLFTVTWFLWLLAVKYPRDESLGAAIILGLVFGLGGGSKATAILCDGVALVAYLWAQNGLRGLFRPRTLARFATVIGVAVLVCGWWYARNQMLYGRLTPIATGFAPADLGWLPAAGSGMLVQMMHPNFPGLFGRAVAGIFDSMWSQKDWIPENLRAAIYWPLFGFVVVGLLGLIRTKKSEAQTNQTGTVARRIALWSGGAAIAVNAAACVFFALFVHWGWFEGGRYLLASLGGLMLLLALGWRSILGEKRFEIAPFVLGLVLLALNILTIFHLTTVLNPIARAAGLVIAQ